MTSFIIATIDSLQPDYPAITALLLVEQVQLLRAAGNLTTINAIPKSNMDLQNASPSSRDLWVNGLFLASLSFALATALLSVLVKQWLQAYSAMSFGNAQEKTLIRQFRFAGFIKWKVSEIIGVLPLILHTSLALFLIGLSVYFSELHSSLCWIVVSVTVVAFAVYLGSILIPTLWLDCPYRIPLLFGPASYVAYALRILRWGFEFLWILLLNSLKRASKNAGFTSRIGSWEYVVPSYPSFSRGSLKHAEIEYLQSDYVKHLCLADTLSWLCSMQSNQSIQKITTQSLHGILTQMLGKRLRYRELKIIALYHDRLKIHFETMSEIMWAGFVEVPETDPHGLDVWCSLILKWIEISKMGYTDWNLYRIDIALKWWNFALTNNNLVAIRRFLELEKKFEVSNASCIGLEGWKETALYIVAWTGNIEVAKLLVQNGAHISGLGKPYPAPLNQAISRRNIRMLKYLIQDGGDINDELLHQAIIQTEGDIRIIKMLVENGASVNAQGGLYGNPLQAAASRWKSLELVQFLVEKGAIINAQGGHFGYSLQAAAWEGELDVVKFLLENGADINAQGGGYGNALQAAAYRQQINVVKFLVENGVQVSEQGGMYGNALQAAAAAVGVKHVDNREEALKIAQCLVTAGADVNAQGGQYGNALHAAAHTGNLGIFELLLDHGANDTIQVVGEHGSILQAASYGGNLKIVQELVERGANVNAQGGRYGIPLQAAACRGNLNIFMYLIHKGANINLQGGEYGLMLQAGAYGGNIDIVKYLVVHGANISEHGGKYGTALHAATDAQKSQVVKYLVSKGADINAKSMEYGTPLHVASTRSDLEIVKYLVQNGANINAVGGESGMALQAAAATGNLDIVKFLVQRGADVNARGGRYDTALQAAAGEAYNSWNVVKFLIQNGADGSLHGGKYGTALEAAKVQGKWNLVQYLQNSLVYIN